MTPVGGMLFGVSGLILLLLKATHSERHASIVFKYDDYL